MLESSEVNFHKQITIRVEWKCYKESGRALQENLRSPNLETINYKLTSFRRKRVLYEKRKQVFLISGNQNKITDYPLIYLNNTVLAVQGTCVLKCTTPLLTTHLFERWLSYHSFAIYKLGIKRWLVWSRLAAAGIVTRENQRKLVRRWYMYRARVGRTARDAASRTGRTGVMACEIWNRKTTIWI